MRSYFLSLPKVCSQLVTKHSNAYDNGGLFSLKPSHTHCSSSFSTLLSLGNEWSCLQPGHLLFSSASNLYVPLYISFLDIYSQKSHFSLSMFSKASNRKITNNFIFPWSFIVLIHLSPTSLFLNMFPKATSHICMYAFLTITLTKPTVVFFLHKCQ